MEKYLSTHNTCTKYTQSANNTCDESIKNVVMKKIHMILCTYLFRPIYLLIPTYLPT